MKSRYEQMLEAIANGEKITSEPTSRLEKFLKALANKEGVSDLPKPTCREEEGWMAIIKGEPITKEPQSKREVFLKAIANKDPIPEGTAFGAEEELFKQIINNGGPSGGGSTPSEPTTYTVTFGEGVIVQNGDVAIISGSTVESGTVLTIDYALSEHYHLVSFQVNGVDAENNSTITITGNTNIVLTQAIDTYTVTFDSRVTVLNGETNLTSGDAVPYGTSLVVSYTLTDGYKLTSFQVNGVDTENNSTITVTDNMEIVFVEEEEISSGGGEFSRTFSENSPATIAQIGSEIAAAGMTSAQVAETYGWNIGDTTIIPLSTGENIEMRIIGFNHDDLSDGSGKAGITLQMVNCLGVEEYSFGGASGGYAVSTIKLSTLPTIKATIPQEWQDIIKPVDKKSANGGSTGYTETVTTSDDLFILSAVEVCSTQQSDHAVVQSRDTEGTTYAYWVDKDDAGRIKYKDTDGDGVYETAADWWLRSRITANDYQGTYVWSGSGAIYARYLTDSNRACISFAFCVGAASDLNSGGSGDAGGDASTFSRTFSENTPAQISAVSAEISANNMTSAQVAETYGWNIGDTTTIPLSTGENIEMRIIGFNHDDLSDGSGKAGITLDMTHCLAAQTKMHWTKNNAAGYGSSAIRTETLPWYKTTLPQAWQDIVKTVNKLAATGAGNSSSVTLETYADQLFVPSHTEVSGVSPYFEEGTVYEYYSDGSASKRNKKYDSDSDGIYDTTAYWWLRTHHGNRYDFYAVYAGGSTGAQTSNYNASLSFAFCV